MTDQTTTRMTDAQYATEPKSNEPRTLQPRKLTLDTPPAISREEIELHLKMQMAAKMSRLRRHNR